LTYPQAALNSTSTKKSIKNQNKVVDRGVSMIQFVL